MKRLLPVAVLLGSLVVGCTGEQPSDSLRSPAVNLLAPAPTPVVGALYSGECNVGKARVHTRCGTSGVATPSRAVDAHRTGHLHVRATHGCSLLQLSRPKQRCRPQSQDRWPRSS